jgi:Tfp pilus assembly major pilin PilA
VTGLGFALVQYWLVGLGVILILTTVAGLLFEYYVGARAPLR